MSQCHVARGACRVRGHRLVHRFLFWLAFATLLLSHHAALVGRASAAGVDEGFGAATPGGAGKPIVHVTNLNDSGPGSLREAISAGHRYVVFDVAGDIALSSHLYVKGPYVTIDGSSAPAPGITLRYRSLRLSGSHGAHDVIVTGIRVRDATDDGITINGAAYNIVIDHVSVQGNYDGNIDITDGSHDVTVQWSIIAEPASTQKNMLIKYNPSRVTLHHNVFVAGQQRNPQARIDDTAGTPATDTTLDMRNNLVWDWRNGYGTLVWYGPRANIVNNFYSSPESPASEQAKAIEVNQARAYVAGNVSGDGLGFDVNRVGTEAAPFPAPPVTMQSACEGARSALAGAGVRPLDAIDQRYLGMISLPACGGTPPPPPPPPPPPAIADLVIATASAPGSAAAGASISVGATARNAGTASAAASTTRLSLSTDGALGSGDAMLGTVAVPSLAAGASTTATIAVTIPVGTAPGSYQLILKADADGAVTESNEANNVLVIPLTVASPPPGRADLVLSSVSAPSTADAGATVTMSAVTKNIGTATAASSRTRFYLSGSTTVDASAVALGSKVIPSLLPGASQTETEVATIPAGTTGGPYYIVVAADVDGAVAETSETNNTSAVAIAITGTTVTEPDLVFTAASVPTSARRGATIGARYTLKNQGAAAGASRMKFYLSKDALDNGDVTLGARRVSALAAGASTSGTKSLTIPSTIAAGTYYILIVADRDNVVAERREDNNVIARRITIR